MLTIGDGYSIKDYLEETNVQLGATYNVAKQSTDTYIKGLKAAAGFMNAHPDEIGMAIISPSISKQYKAPKLIFHCSHRPINNPALRESLSNSQHPSSLRIRPLFHRPRSQYLLMGPSCQTTEPHGKMVDSVQRVTAFDGRELAAATLGKDSISGMHTYKQRPRDHT